MIRRPTIRWQRRWRNLRLSIKVIGATLLILALMMLLAGWGAISSERETLQERTRVHGNALAGTVAAFSAEPMLALDFPILETYAETLAKERYEVAYVRVEKRDGMVVAQAQDPQFNLQKALADGEARLFTAEIRVAPNAPETIGQVLIALLTQATDKGHGKFKSPKTR